MKEYKVHFYILPKKEILDIVGRRVEKKLQKENFSSHDCRVGKYIKMTVKALNKEQALVEAQKMVDTFLINPMVEECRLEVEL